MLKIFDGFLLWWDLFFLLFLYVSNTTEFYKDTDNYWRTSDEFIIDGKFNLNPLAVEIPSEYAQRTFPYKGIIFPLLLLVARGGVTGLFYWTTLSIFYSLGYTIIMAETFQRLLSIKLNVVGRLLPIVFTMILWPGLVQYPLTEITSTILICASIFIFQKLLKSKKAINYILWSFLLGLILYVSYNIRSSMFIAAIFLGIVTIVIKKANTKRNILVVGVSLFAGVFLLGSWQAYVNSYAIGKATIATPLSVRTGFTERTLYIGLTMARFETAIIPNVTAGMVYPNHVAEEILYEEIQKGNVAAEGQLKFSEYIKVAFNNPLEMLGLYMAKIVNGVDSRFGEIYIKDLYSKRLVRILLSYTILFAFSLGIFLKFRKEIRVREIDLKLQETPLNVSKKISLNPEISTVLFIIKKYWVYLFFLGLPLLVHIVAPVEPRYYFIIFIVAFFYGSSSKSCLNIKECFVCYPLSVVFSYVVVLGVFLAIWVGTFNGYENVALFY